jgi:methylated-DNA-[protein]-cysteine S-methyltransferase
MFYYEYNSPFGEIMLTANEHGLTGLAFQQSDAPINLSAECYPKPELFSEVCRQLDQYFEGKRFRFQLPLAPKGTLFQQQVWHALQSIPYGETVSYQQIAQMIQRPKAMRAVGAANGRNPIALVVPCHRVIGANGQLTGYAGGLNLKAALLSHEQRYCHVAMH